MLRMHMKRVSISSLLAISLAVSTFFVTGDAFAQRRPSPEQIRESKRKSRPISNVRYISVHRMAGCGLGAQVFDSDEKFSQAAASLLNFTGLQSVMISFGISGCTYDGITEEARETQAFVESNIADVRHNLSIGSGEYVLALASLYGCPDSLAPEFASVVREAYAREANRAMSSQDLISMMDTAVSGSKPLQEQCSQRLVSMSESEASEDGVAQ